MAEDIVDPLAITTTLAATLFGAPALLGLLATLAAVVAAVIVMTGR